MPQLISSKRTPRRVWCPVRKLRPRYRVVILFAHSRAYRFYPHISLKFIARLPYSQKEIEKREKFANCESLPTLDSENEPVSKILS